MILHWISTLPGRLYSKLSITKVLLRSGRLRRHGMHSALTFISMVYNKVEVRVLCRKFEFFHSNLGTPCHCGLGLCTKAWTCWKAWFQWREIIILKHIKIYCNDQLSTNVWIFIYFFTILLLLLIIIILVHPKYFKQIL